LKKKKVINHAKAVNVAGTAHGRKYGYFLRKSEFPNRSGYLSAGRDSQPPIAGLRRCQ
jgi:hypothetical protein